jgi:hypothetical protein
MHGPFEYPAIVGIIVTCDQRVVDIVVTTKYRPMCGGRKVFYF